MNTAFTIVELLVVVTIIVILLAMLTPALDKAMEEAEKTLCAANLHAFAAGSAQYAFDHRNRMLKLPRHYRGAGQGAGDGLAYPWFVWLYSETFPDEISLEAMRPYFGETQPASLQTTTLGKLWKCPSSQMADLRRLNETSYIKQPRGPVVLSQDEGPGFWSEYAYFGGGGGTVPAKYATTRYRLDKGRAGSVGILVGDNIFRHSNLNWYYNHGVYQRTPSQPPSITGGNYAHSDGSARWIAWDDTRREAAFNVGPKDSMGDFISATGKGADANAVTSDLFTFY